MGGQDANLTKKITLCGTGILPVLFALLQAELPLTPVMTAAPIK
ncbi:hypothetical protein E5S67_03991 [Microcoleus sp. IPMA8]|uniref:Uncharacterized protein n=1 Tax=Microcoleus asticus IPMA8 TaxID=2563858 RepID=A0ABX2D237_9CYAN|nr:hypothetical protein [Microcoleus asticus IPMA8]